MLKFTLIFLLSHAVMGATPDITKKEALLETWTSELVWSKLQPTLQTIPCNERIRVRYFCCDKIHGVWPGKLTAQIARTLKWNGYRAFAYDSIFDAETNLTAGKAFKHMVIITLQDYASKVVIPPDQEQNILHVVVDFTDLLYKSETI